MRDATPDPALGTRVVAQTELEEVIQDGSESATLPESSFRKIVVLKMVQHELQRVIFVQEALQIVEESSPSGCLCKINDLAVHQAGLEGPPLGELCSPLAA